MDSIRHSPRSLLTTDTEQQRPRQRANATACKAPARCADLSTNGAIPVHPAQPAAVRATLTLSIVPSKTDILDTSTSTLELRESTAQAFRELSDCEANVFAAFSPSKSKQANTSVLDTKIADLRKAYKIWRDSPVNLPQAEMDKREADWDIAKKKAGIRPRYAGAEMLSKILGQETSFKRNIDPVSHGFRDVKTGLYCELRLANSDMENPHYLLCFPGTGAGDMDVMQWSNNIDQAIGTGGVPPAYKQAAELTKFLRDELKKIKPNAELGLTGHSLGGGIANFVGLKYDLPTVLYNAAPLGGACLRELGTISQETLDKQQHIRCKGDTVSSPKVQEKLQSFMQIWSTTAIWVPRNAGKIVELGMDYASEKKGHERHLLSVFDAVYNPLALPPKVSINLLQMA